MGGVWRDVGGVWRACLLSISVYIIVCTAHIIHNDAKPSTGSFH